MEQFSNPKHINDISEVNLDIKKQILNIKTFET